MRLRFEKSIPVPRTVLAAFHEDPANLAVLHHGWSRFRLLCHEGTRVGCRTWFEITVAGILPVALGFEHTHYEPPGHYSEKLIHGPFREFIHTHQFEEKQGGVVVCDVLEISLPWYYGGEALTRVLLAPLFEDIFHRRHEALLAWAASNDQHPAG
jgi:ligand-binding SRPBCC domain-containing protein